MIQTTNQMVNQWIFMDLGPKEGFFYPGNLSWVTDDAQHIGGCVADIIQPRWRASPLMRYQMSLASNWIEKGNMWRSLVISSRKQSTPTNSTYLQMFFSTLWDVPTRLENLLPSSSSVTQRFGKTRETQCPEPSGQGPRWN